MVFMKKEQTLAKEYGQLIRMETSPNVEKT